MWFWCVAGLVPEQTCQVEEEEEDHQRVPLSRCHDPSFLFHHLRRYERLLLWVVPRHSSGHTLGRDHADPSHESCPVVLHGDVAPRSRSKLPTLGRVTWRPLKSSGQFLQWHPVHTSPCSILRLLQHDLTSGRHLTLPGGYDVTDFL